MILSDDLEQVLRRILHQHVAVEAVSKVSRRASRQLLRPSDNLIQPSLCH